MLPPPPPRHPSTSHRSPPPSQPQSQTHQQHPHEQHKPALSSSTVESQPPVLPSLPRRVALPPSQPASPHPHPHPPSPPPPPPRHPSLPAPGEPSIAVQQKLQLLEDAQVNELLERVGGQLTELRVKQLDDDDEVVWPEKEAFRLLDGKVDWISYGIACALVLATSSVPASLITPPPSTRFSLRALRRSLERLYILFPPAAWQPFLTGTLTHLYRWEDPFLTGSYLAVYLFLWFFDLFLLCPVGVLLGYLLRTRLYPPSPEQLVAQAEVRAARTKEATKLGKQLQTSSRFGIGIAGEGVRGLWSEVKERVGRGEDEGDEHSIANGLGSGALLGGLPGMPSGAADNLRRRVGLQAHHRSTSSTDSTFTTPPSPTGTPSGGSTQPSSASTTSPGPRPEEPAQGISGSSDDVSLYRLARNLARTFGPHVQLWAEEVADLSEMLKNTLLHPSHPSSILVLLRLLTLCLTLLLVPIWLQYKSIGLGVGVEFFALWRAREVWPHYRRALLPWWWLFLGAPTDAEYALYVLKKRNAEGRPLKGSKTIRREKKREKKSENRKQRTSDCPGYAFLYYIAGYFALHLSTPGRLDLTPLNLTFTPVRKIRHLGKLVSRFSSSTTSSSSGDEGDSVGAFSPSSSVATTSATRSSFVAGSAQGMEIAVGEIKGVRKVQSWVKAMEGLVVTLKGGEVFRFNNVFKRDECFNKLLSVSGASWEAA
ncbi:hypothetical protein JCM11641_006059 [Rhodosporidiobolus odoratus]